jgi:hypothetical protein
MLSDSLTELLGVLRGMTENVVMADAETHLVMMRGTPEQVALGEWILRGLEKAVAVRPDQAVNERYVRHHFEFLNADPPYPKLLNQMQHVELNILPRAITIAKLWEVYGELLGRRLIGIDVLCLLYAPGRALFIRGAPEQVGSAQTVLVRLLEGLQ